MNRVCQCGQQLRHQGRKARQLLTAAGSIKLSRRYFECVRCQRSGYLVDDRIGVEGRYSHNAQRLICLAAASWSYDIFHAPEHLAAMGKVLHSDAAEFQQWYAEATETLIAGGYSVIDEFVRCNLEKLSAPQQEAVDQLRNYLGPHAQYLNYADRLAAGQSIGSGQIDGACKI